MPNSETQYNQKDLEALTTAKELVERAYKVLANRGINVLSSDCVKLYTAIWNQWEIARKQEVIIDESQIRMF